VNSNREATMTADLIARAISGLSVDAGSTSVSDAAPKPVAPSVSRTRHDVAVAAALGLAGFVGIIAAIIVALVLSAAPVTGTDGPDGGQQAAAYAGGGD
jgi:hypothetical protein